MAAGFSSLEDLSQPGPNQLVIQRSRKTFRTIGIVLLVIGLFWLSIAGNMATAATDTLGRFLGVAATLVFAIAFGGAGLLAINGPDVITIDRSDRTIRQQFGGAIALRSWTYDLPDFSAVIVVRRQSTSAPKMMPVFEMRAVPAAPSADSLMLVSMADRTQALQIADRVAAFVSLQRGPDQT